jgi:drug/metabolite transporter (DMT)-like permease
VPVLPSLALIIASLVTYQIAQHAVPAGANPWSTLCVVYLIGAAITATAWLLGNRDGRTEILSPPTIGLGLAVVGIELGYLTAYRAGARLGTLGLVANTAAAAVLAVVGIGYLGERVTARMVVGVAVCVAGLATLRSD